MSPEHVGKAAVTLSVVEVGLGSFLHSLHIPFSGHFLSLNQGFVIARAAKEAKALPTSGFIPMHVSNVAAILKSLSPVGKKLTPMLALSAQGSLFTVGTMLFGITPLGFTVGMILLSVWAFLQPVLIYLLLYGKTLVD